jgi:FkbM family methyltransferase
VSLDETKRDFTQGRLEKADFIRRMHAEHLRLHEYSEFIRGTNVASIEITDGRVAMTLRDTGLRFSWPKEERRVAPLEMLNFGDYERPCIEGIVSLVDEGACVFDVGANIGWHALTIARRVPRARVFAFEPVPWTFRELEGNIALNKGARVKAFELGFSDSEGERTFFVRPGESDNACSAEAADAPDARQVICRLTRLDAFVEAGGHRVDYIKCDVEGGELSVFRGAVETLRRDKPVVFTEMLRKWAARFGYHPNEIIAMLEGLGYRCFTVGEGGRLAEFGRMDDATMETNFFFLHRDKHREKIARASAR